MKTLLKLTVVSFVLAFTVHATPSASHTAAPAAGIPAAEQPVSALQPERAPAPAASMVGNFNAEVNACVAERTAGKNNDSLDMTKLMSVISAFKK